MILLAGEGVQAGPEGADLDPPPVPREEMAADWERFDVETGTIFASNLLLTDVTGYKHIEKYEHRTLRDTVSELTLDRFPEDEETPLMAFFTARIAIRPNVASVPLLRRAIHGRAAAAIKEQFEADLTDNGLTDIEEGDPGNLDLDPEQFIDLTRYEASFPAPTTEVDLVDDKTLMIDPGEMAVEGALAVWEAEGDLLIAGGAYPAQDFASSIHEQVTDAVGVTLDIELGLEPDAYEATIVGIIESMVQSDG